MKPARRLPIIRSDDTRGIPIVLVPLDPKGNRWAVVEAADYDRLPERLKSAPWLLNDNGSGNAYVKASIPSAPGGLVRVHRVVIGAPQGQAVHFMSQDRCDLRRSNMRLRKDRKARRDHRSDVLDAAA